MIDQNACLLSDPELCLLFREPLRLQLYKKWFQTLLRRLMCQHNSCHNYLHPPTSGRRVLSVSRICSIPLQVEAPQMGKINAGTAIIRVLLQALEQVQQCPLQQRPLCLHPP